MLRRMHDHDYQSRCIYMLTITLADRSQPLLGTLTKDANGDATVNATDLGQHVIQEWHNLCHDYPQVEIIRLQVRCHNNTTSQNLHLIEQQKKYFLECGKKGGVVVSPCISAGEKEIARAALEAKQPLIVVLENGFPPMYKPPGRLFDACAEGLLLMLAPWPFHMEKRTITRDQCLQLNAMAAAISNVPWTEELEQALLKAGEGAG